MQRRCRPRQRDAADGSTQRLLRRCRGRPVRRIMGVMTGALHVFLDGPLDGATNMARDEALLYSDEHQPAALRVYGWTPATISLGCFQRYDDVAALPVEVRGLPVVRRITGGGAILHDREITYCLTLDDSLDIARAAPAELYRLVHRVWCDVLATDGNACELAPEDWPMPSPRSGPFFCFQKPGRTDVLLGGAKLIGSAQRRLPGRVLQHGSVILGRRFAAHPGASLGDPPPERVGEWIGAFADRVAAALGLERCAGVWSPALIDDVARRRVRFASDTWTRRR
ncbi:MAG: lipoate--protein ligase family protein [Planctomycetota bacterium]|nr:MAG: lipoate--protein ligase family protein [Planctomycetota bacterium]